VDLVAQSHWQHLVLLLPAVIVGAGLVLGVLILLGRAFAATVRESGHPRWILGGLVALLGAIVLLTYLGVELPRE
jgi:O-antigen ligase